MTIYTTPTCPYCRKTKDWMTKHKVHYIEINVADDEEAARKMIEESGQTGVPVWKITDNNRVVRVVVGYDIDALEEEFNNK